MNATTISATFVGGCETTPIGGLVLGWTISRSGGSVHGNTNPVVNKTVSHTATISDPSGSQEYDFGAWLTRPADGLVVFSGIIVDHF